MNIKPLLEQLIHHEQLSTEQMQNVMHACMRGEINDTQLGAFLALMRMKGETTDELATAATVLLHYAHRVSLGQSDCVDIVGTGGDGMNTFNVSTAASFVASAAGAKVAKHGNRSVSSRSGSADLLEQAGIRLDLSDAELKRCIEANGLCFLFAPHFHHALKQVRAARQALGIRSFFNLIGPLLNPAQVQFHVVGVCAASLLTPIAEILPKLGSQRALVVHAHNGMDEISVNSITEIIEVDGKGIRQWQFDPEKYGLFHESIQDTLVKSAAESLEIIEQVFAGKSGAARDMVVVNSGAALYCAGHAKDMGEGIDMALQAIDSGRASHQLNQLRQFS